MPVIDITTDISVGNQSTDTIDVTSQTNNYTIDFGTNFNRIFDPNTPSIDAGNTGAVARQASFRLTASNTVTVEPNTIFTTGDFGFRDDTTDAPAGTAIADKPTYNIPNSVIVWNGTANQGAPDSTVGNFLIQGHVNAANSDWIIANSHNISNDLYIGGYAGRKRGDGLSADFTNTRFIIPADDTPAAAVLWSMAPVDPTNLILTGIEFLGPWVAVCGAGLHFAAATLNGGSADNQGAFNYRTANVAGVDIGALPQRMSTFSSCRIGAWNAGVQTSGSGANNYQHILFNCDIRVRDNFGNLTGGNLTSIDIDNRAGSTNHSGAHILAWLPRFTTGLGADLPGGQIALALDGATSRQEYRVQTTSIDDTDTTWLSGFTSTNGIVTYESGTGIYFRRRFATAAGAGDTATLNLALDNFNVPYFTYEGICYENDRTVSTVTTDQTAMTDLNTFDTTDVINTVVNPDPDIEGISRAVAGTYTGAGVVAVDTGSKLLAGLKHWNAVDRNLRTANYSFDSGTGIIDFFDTVPVSFRVNNPGGTTEWVRSVTANNIYLRGSMFDADSKVNTFRYTNGEIDVNVATGSTDGGNISLEAGQITFVAGDTINKGVVATNLPPSTTAEENEGTIRWNLTVPSVLIDTQDTVSGTIVLDAGTYTIRNSQDLSGLRIQRSATAATAGSDVLIVLEGVNQANLPFVINGAQVSTTFNFTNLPTGATTSLYDATTRNLLVANSDSTQTFNVNPADEVIAVTTSPQGVPQVRAYTAVVGANQIDYTGFGDDPFLASSAAPTSGYTLDVDARASNSGLRVLTTGFGASRANQSFVLARDVRNSAEHRQVVATQYGVGGTATSVANSDVYSSNRARLVFDGTPNLLVGGEFRIGPAPGAGTQQYIALADEAGSSRNFATGFVFGDTGTTYTSYEVYGEPVQEILNQNLPTTVARGLELRDENDNPIRLDSLDTAYQSTLMFNRTQGGNTVGFTVVNPAITGEAAQAGIALTVVNSATDADGNTPNPAVVAGNMVFVTRLTYVQTATPETSVAATGSFLPSDEIDYNRFAIEVDASQTGVRVNSMANDRLLGIKPATHNTI